MQRVKMNSLSRDDSKILQRMKEEYLTCPAAVKYVKSLGIPEEEIDKNIDKIHDFVADVTYCKKCPGLMQCDKETPRLCTKIVYEKGAISRQFVPCKKYLEYVKFQSQFITRDFPEEWLSNKLEDVDKTVQRGEVVRKYMAYYAGEASEFVYIVGESGTGRSYLAANIGIDIARKDKGPVAFLDVPSRFKELYHKKDESFNSLIEKYMNVPVLILDDLGNEYKSDFVRDSIFLPILNYRCKNKLYTIITSDFTINDIVTMYSTSQSSRPRAEQIKKLLNKNFGKEINLGDLSIYE